MEHPVFKVSMIKRLQYFIKDICTLYIVLPTSYLIFKFLLPFNGKNSKINIGVEVKA